MNPSLTLFICTHNRAELLGRMLSSIDAAEQPADWTIKVLVIANACTDDTVEVLQKHRSLAPGHENPELLWEEEPRLGKSHALNRGIGLLDTDWVMFTDDDHRVDHQFLCAITRAIEAHPGVHLFCGRIIPDWDGTEPAWVHDTGPYRVYPPPIPVFDEGDSETHILPGGTIPGGGNLLIERSVLNLLGGFTTDKGPKGHNLSGGEDSEFVLRALNAREALVYTPDIVQYHFVDRRRLTLGNILKLSYRRSMAIAQLSKNGDGLPLYLLKKIATYLFKSLFSLNFNRTRFYLVRLFSTLGETRGLIGRQR